MDADHIVFGGNPRRGGGPVSFDSASVEFGFEFPADDFENLMLATSFKFRGRKLYAGESRLGGALLTSDSTTFSDATTSLEASV